MMPWEMEFVFCLENFCDELWALMHFRLWKKFSFETSKLCILTSWPEVWLFFCRLNRLKRRPVYYIAHIGWKSVVGHRCRVFWGAFWKTQVKIFKEVIELKGKCYREMKSSRRWLSIYQNNAEQSERSEELLLISKISNLQSSRHISKILMQFRICCF